MDAPFDIAIVGAGIAGASLAWHLAPQARVLLLEREPHAGMHSTGRSAAMFMASYGPPQARALTRASRGFLQAPPAGFASVPLLAPRGALYAGWHGDEQRLAALHTTLQDSGGVIEPLDAAHTLQRVPVLRAEGLIGALFEADAMDIDVDALLQGFLRGARRQGAVLWTEAELAAAQRDGARWTLSCADGRSARATVLVDAAGAWADAVAQRCGVTPIGLVPRRRSAFTFDPPADAPAGWRDWPVTAAIGEGWYFKPDAGQLIGSPANADAVAPHDVQPEDLDIATGIARIEADTALRIRRPRRSWAGLRSFTRDGELAIGFDEHRPGFFWLAGQGGYGIQSCAGAAQLAAALLLGQPLPEALREHGVQALRPRRIG